MLRVTYLFFTGALILQAYTRGAIKLRTMSLVILKIITENFDDISTYFGLIKCTVLPPRGLFHPVLPYRTKDKLMFPLCKTCADTLNQNPCTHTDQERAILGTWCHVELMKAIEKGYKVFGNSRSVALGSNNRRAVQGLRRHVLKDQTRSQRLP